MDNRIFKYVVHLSFSPPAFLEQLILINGFAFLARFSSWRKWSSRVAKSIASCSFRSPLLSDRAGMSRLCSQKTDDDDDDDFPFRGKEGRKEDSMANPLARLHCADCAVGGSAANPLKVGPAGAAIRHSNP